MNYELLAQAGVMGMAVYFIIFGGISINACYNIPEKDTQSRFWVGLVSVFIGSALFVATMDWVITSSVRTLTC